MIFISTGGNEYGFEYFKPVRRMKLKRDQRLFSIRSWFYLSNGAKR